MISLLGDCLHAHTTHVRTCVIMLYVFVHVLEDVDKPIN